MRQLTTTLSEKEVGADRARKVRARRRLVGLRSAGLMLLVAAIPITLAVVLTTSGDTGGTTSVPAPTEVLVRNFEGSGSTSTGVFVVGANWALKWELDGLASDRIEISVRSSGGQDLETIVQEGLGAGEQAIEQGGAYRLVVTSGGDWSIRVLQVSNPSSS